MNHALSQGAAEAKHQSKSAEAAEVVKPQPVPASNIDKDVGDVHTYSILDVLSTYSVLCMHLGASLSYLLYRDTSMGMCGFLPA